MIESAEETPEKQSSPLSQPVSSQQTIYERSRQNHNKKMTKIQKMRVFIKMMSAFFREGHNLCEAFLRETNPRNIKRKEKMSQKGILVNHSLHMPMKSVNRVRFDLPPRKEPNFRTSRSPPPRKIPKIDENHNHVTREPPPPGIVRSRTPSPEPHNVIELSD
eukprot:TRINITY_DN10523_c0_g3_i2.p1 TRINITY_DN10523_c0_g3~~TRINITY_DN10523_c0_g3_i2.p1  ORF type:complete len:162 (-),score=22.17 TRINITY_DN10523_c0_g3_i2:38-523(-)